MVDILSPTNAAAVWNNLWAYASLPALREVLILHADTIRAELWRRDKHGHWPAESEMISNGDVHLTSIGFRAPIADFYRTTPLGAR
ncbi:hypothetical protein J4558_21955 [Leptolyngbya sp. 15MV]|nr:hypothetical protein J4558_21955 [Leptolyngbya sp. 15MV]